MLRKVEVGARVNALNLLEAEWHVELDIGGSIGIVSQLLMIVVAIHCIAEAESLVPGETGLLPLGKPVKFGARLDEELHLHLLEFAHTENELTCHDLVTEGLANLCDAERQLHATRLLHIEIVDKDALCGLRTKVDLHGTIGSRTHLGGEHEVELTYVGPVASAADGAYDLLVEDDLLQFLKVHLVHGVAVTLMQCIPLGLMLQHAAIGSAELSLVESLAETLASLLDLLVDLIFNLGELLLDEHIGTIALLRVAVVDERVVECIHMARSLPDCRVHEDGSIDAHDVLVELGHCLPPVALDIVLEFNTVLTVVIDCAQSVIDFTRRENEAILLAVGHQLLENIFLICHILFN